MYIRQCLLFSFIFFFKQKTAYEMLISDWSSDVCSSDLVGALIAVNPYGSVLVPGTASFWAAPYEIDGEFGGRGFAAGCTSAATRDPREGTKGDSGALAGGNTTIGCVALNADQIGRAHV